MSKKKALDISISKIDSRGVINGLHTNFINIKFKGNDINHTIVNTIRRTIYTLVPKFAFHPNDIKFKKNDSVFNNDYVKLRISSLPIINKSYDKMVIQNEISTLDKVSQLEENANKSNYESTITNIHELEQIKTKHESELLNNLTIHFYAKNDTQNIMDVTTDNAEYYLTTKIDNIYTRPIIIIKLKPGEEFDVTCTASLNIPLYDSIYLNCAACSYEEINDNEYNFYIESDRQISEIDIIKRACKIIIFKLKELSIRILSQVKNNDIIADLKVINENHTMGNLITRVLQDNTNIIFCGYMVDHIAVNELTISYKTDGTSFSNIFKESILYLVSVFENICLNIDNLQ